VSAKSSHAYTSCGVISIACVRRVSARIVSGASKNTRPLVAADGASERIERLITSYSRSDSSNAPLYIRKLAKGRADAYVARCGGKCAREQSIGLGPIELRNVRKPGEDRIRGPASGSSSMAR